MTSALHPETLVQVNSFVDHLRKTAQAIGKIVSDSAPGLKENGANAAEPAKPAEVPEPTFQAALTASTNAPSPLSPTGGDREAQLTAMMLNATKPLAEQVAAGNLPSVVISLDDGNYDPVAVQSPIPPTSALYVWQCNQNMLSLVQLYSALFDITNRQNRGHPEPYNLSNPDDVYQIFAEQANNTLQTILEGPLSGFYVANRGETKQFTQQVTSAADLPALHTNFLSTIFKDFNLTANATNALDQLLSAFATAVGGFKLSAEARSKTIDYTLKINTVATIDLTEDPNNPILIYIPKTTLIYMRIKATAWQDAMAACAGTAGGAEQFEFDMTYEKTECQLDIYYYEQNIDRFDNILQFCTGQSLAAYGASLSQVVLNK